jgi:DNA polymerase elongation subunit (family B)
MQKDMLAVLAEADDVAGCRARVGRVSAIAEAVRERIAEGRVERGRVGRHFYALPDPSEYVSNGPSAVAAKRLAASGVPLHAGETVRYIITSSGDKVVDFRATPLAFVSEAPEVDTKKYLELWQRCRDEIMDGLEEKPRRPGARRSHRIFPGAEKPKTNTKGIFLLLKNKHILLYSIPWTNSRHAKKKFIRSS